MEVNFHLLDQEQIRFQIGGMQIFLENGQKNLFIQTLVINTFVGNNFVEFDNDRKILNRLSKEFGKP